MVWSTLALGIYQLRFVSWMFHVNFSFVHFISLYTMGGLRAFSKPLPYNMYLFNLRIANHILIKMNIWYISILQTFAQRYDVLPCIWRSWREPVWGHLCPCVVWPSLASCQWLPWWLEVTPPPNPYSSTQTCISILSLHVIQPIAVLCVSVT